MTMTPPVLPSPPGDANPARQEAGSWAALRWAGDHVVMLDQRKLPGEEASLQLRDVEAVARAIETMVIRGAPAIGCAAAMGIALGAVRDDSAEASELRKALLPAFGRLADTRPTAVNLFSSLDRMRGVLEARLAMGDSAALVRERLVAEAQAIFHEDIASCHAIGRAGAELIPDGATVLTHCNAGALATAGHGTALGVIRSAVAAGRSLQVFAGETRPFLQGARLTAWELARDGIPVSVITDGMAGHFMRRGEIDLVIVGADRIAANGDVANKIGTYGLAVLARHHGLPFYVAAPLSTLDLSTSSGDEIPIEERGRQEFTTIAGHNVVPDDAQVRHPAFDVTPADLVTALVTDAGLVRAPYAPTLRALGAPSR